MRRVLTVLICCLFFPPLARSEPAGGWAKLRTTISVNFARDQGLPHPVVMAIAQDAQGLMWVGTQGGLARFDGYRFRAYLHRDNDPTSLPSDVISALITDAKGRLWLGTYTGEVAWYDAASDGFHTIAEPPGVGARGSVTALSSDGGSGVWAATSSGLDHIEANGHVTHYSHRDSEPDSLPSDLVRSVRVGKDGTVWVATYRGLVRKRPDAEAFEPVPLVGQEGGVLDDLVLGLIEASDGHIWFVTFQSQVGRIADDRLVARSLYDLSSSDVGGPSSYGLIEGRDGELWIARVSGGITQLDMATGATQQIRHEPTVTVSLADDAVRTLFKGRSGVIWAGSNRGLSMINPISRAVDSIMPSSLPGHLSDPNVLNLAAVGNKAWLALKDKGGAMLDPEAGVVLPVGISAALPPGSVPALAAQPDGTLWVAAGTGRALYRIDPVTGKGSPVAFPNGETSILSSLLWNDGTLWVGAGPLLRYTPKDGDWQVYRHNGTPGSLTDESVSVVLPDGKKGLWVGTQRGLDHLDLASGTFTHAVHADADPQSLPSDFVAALLIDRKGRLWVSTLGSGLAVTDPAAGQPLRFRHIGTGEGLPNATADGLQQDEQGRIWVSTDDGLAVIDPETLSVRALGREEGVAIPSYWNDSSAKLADGTILFGGVDGVSAVHPDQLIHTPFKPSLVVTEIRIGNRSVPPAQASKTLVLGPHERNIEVEFAALDFSASNKLRYAYKLSDFDDDWVLSEPGRRLAAYTNLPPGDYHLLLRATDRDGAWLEPVTLKIMVEPAWWQSWWFELLTAFAAFAAIFGLVQLRTRYLLGRRQHLEALVASQTKDLLEANKRLQEIASHDFLTGIYNRRYFFELATTELERARRSGRAASLIMIDVDHFKRVNDTYGHGAGDEVLRGVVRCVNAMLREGDLFARYGGEEMVVLMPETTAEAARLVAERLRQAVAAETYRLPEGEITVTASFGLATAGTPPESLADLLDRADHALYAAKSKGRNRVEEAPQPA